jgi:hypothetical protein
MKFKALIFLTALFLIPMENFAAPAAAENTMEIQMTKKKKKKKKKGGLFKKKCKCPKIK